MVIKIRPLVIGISALLFLGPAVITGLTETTISEHKALYWLSLLGFGLGIYASTGPDGWIDEHGLFKFGPKYHQLSIRAMGGDLQRGTLFVTERSHP